MSRSNDAGHFFQTSDALASTERKAKKSKNKYGNPVKLPSKVLAASIDHTSERAVFVAEANGEVKRIILEVCKNASTMRSTHVVLKFHRPMKYKRSSHRLQLL